MTTLDLSTYAPEDAALLRAMPEADRKKYAKALGLVPVGAPAAPAAPVRIEAVVAPEPVVPAEAPAPRKVYRETRYNRRIGRGSIKPDRKNGYQRISKGEGYVSNYQRRRDEGLLPTLGLDA